MSADVIWTAWCPRCSGEGRSESGRLGVLERTPKGSLRWVVEDRRRGRRRVGGRKVDLGVYLKRRASSGTDMPAKLPALCERHGRGWVYSDDVLKRCANVRFETSATS